MEKTPATIPPSESGYYVCWLMLTQRPVVLWWSASSSVEWRSGALRMSVVAYMGPLPK